MYEKVDNKLNFNKNEKDVIDFWKQNDVFKKSLEKNEGHDYFNIYDGPPTANGIPHIGHTLARAMKDLIPRYKTMKGYYVPRKAGWDTHGLPVELEVEKIIGSNGKKDIEKYGIDKFIALCKESVWKYKNMWEDITERFGYWIDMDEPYVTYENNYIESVWWALKEMDKKGLIYKGHKIIPYCPRCGTSLSKMEVEMNYKDVKEKSVYVKMKSLEEENTYFLVWTTTPWTLPSNVAICMNPNETYVKIKTDNENYILVENLLPKLFEEGSYEVLYRKQGKEFEHQKYQPLFDYTEDEVKNGYFVVVDDYVTLEDGTGIVHIAPAFGAEDYEVGKKYDLPVVQLIDDSGKFIDKATDYAGMFMKDADKAIIKDLASDGRLFKAELYAHSYPHCWRCETPLLYYAKSTWFVKTTAVKDKLIKHNKEVNWFPETIKDGRMGNFLENNIDWGISRSRYWGTPLPFWTCECGHIHVVGSVEELKKLSGKDISDLHKPMIDEIKIPCPHCGKLMERTSEVMDCWFDSGSMPFAQYHYPFENVEKFNNCFPADYICEGIDQTRGWFYTLQVINSILFDKNPYKSCISVGLVNDKFGLKMSKSKGNGIDAWKILNNEGADALRFYYYYSCNPGTGISFNEDNLIDLQRKFLGTLWNTYAFYILYADIDNFDPTKVNIKDCKLAFIDKWILSELNSTIKYIDENLEKYDIANCAKKMIDFVDMLSNWYVRRSRERFWVNGESEDKTAAFKTLYTVLSEFIKVIAPFVPFISEKIYQNLVRSVDKNAPLSVHLCDYPKVDTSFIDEKLNIGMEEVLRIVVLGRASRNSANVKNRQPLSKAIICTAQELNLDDELLNLIKEELNVEQVRIIQDASEYVEYELKPQLKTLGPKYGPKLGLIKEFLSTSNANSIIKKLKAGESITIRGQDIELSQADVLIAIHNKEGYASESDGYITVVLDTYITEELKEKGIVREIISKIQNFRKDSGLEVVNHITLEYDTDLNISNLLEKNKIEITKETLCDSLKQGSSGEFNTTIDLNGEILNLYMNVKK